MNVKEMIQKYNIKLASDGERLSIPATAEAKKAMPEIAAAKPEIIKEIKKIKAEFEIRKAEREAAEAVRLAELKKTAKKYLYWAPNWCEVAIYEAVPDPDQNKYSKDFNGKMLVALPDGIQKLNLSVEEAYKIAKINKDEWYSFNGCENYAYLIDEKTATALTLISNEKTKNENAAFESEKIEKEKNKAAVYASAKESGKPQVLQIYTVECDDPREECSTDIITVYAMPDGTEKTERKHTW